MPDDQTSATAGRTLVRRAEPGFDAGLRAFFEYRDLGIRAATGGRFGAHVIRAVPGAHPSGQWHTHTLDFQMVYILRGWVRFEYADIGEVTVRAGDCIHQPPGIRHREIAHADDLEVLEITSPAEFETQLAEPALDQGVAAA